MGRVTLPYVTQWTDRKTGRVYTFFRYMRWKTPLPSPEDPAFGEAYAEAIRTIAGRSSAAPAPRSDTLSWLISQYQRSPEFKSLAPRTRRDYAGLLAPIRGEHGDRTFKAQRKHIIALIRDPLAETPRKADATVSAISSVYTWAMSRDLIEENPCRGIDKLYKPEGYRAWMAAEIAKFAAVCSDWEWLVFCFGFYTTLRAGDIVKLTWFQYDVSVITLRQSKTKEPQILTVHPVLKESLDAQTKKEGYIVTRPNGRPYTDGSDLSNRWASSMRRKELLGCTIHGLRKTTPGILAELGATDAQLMSVTGHRTRSMVQLYTRSAEQRRLNEASVAMLRTLKRG